MNVLKERKKNLSFIFKAFKLSNLYLAAVSWLNMKTQKGKSPYLASSGLDYDANIEFFKLNVCIEMQPRFSWSFWYSFSFLYTNTNEVGEFNRFKVHNLIENTQNKQS